MKEHRPVCPSCPHPFHALAPCANYDISRGRPCDCEGRWHEQTKQISGFCYSLTGTPVAMERASHAACPGEDYYYPCECDCHDG